jgi:hypothetical protein
MPFWIVKPCCLVGGYQTFITQSSIPQKNRRSVSLEASSKFPLTWHNSVYVCFTGSSMVLDIWTLKKSFPPPPHYLFSVRMKKPVLSKSYVPLLETQFMFVDQVTFSLPTCLSAVDLCISCSHSFWPTLYSYLLSPAMNLSNHLSHRLPT